MKNYEIILFSAIVIAIIMSGCAMLPYNNEFSCQKGNKDSSCERVSVNYYQSKESRMSTYEQYQASKRNTVNTKDDKYRNIIVLGNGEVLQN